LANNNKSYIYAPAQTRVKEDLNFTGSTLTGSEFRGGPYDKGGTSAASGSAAEPIVDR
jgi:hypothetical protein